MRALTLLSALPLALGAAASAQPPPGLPAVPAASAASRLPIREVTVFKDGHAFVLQEGELPTDARGDVRLDSLPVPVLGTYWPYSAQPGARLVSVTSATTAEPSRRPVRNVAELIEANPGGRVTIVQTDGRTVSGELVAAPGSASAIWEGTATDPRTLGPLALRSGSLMLRSGDGVTLLPLALVKTLTFRGDYQSTLPAAESRARLSLRLDWTGAPARSARVGMVYVQKGIRWIPNYRISIDGRGTATVRMQATLLNELADLDDVTANLVVGVPTFFFKETPDPIAMQESFPALSRYFQTDSLTGFAFSNTISGGGGLGGFGGGFGGAVSRCGPEGEVLQPPAGDTPSADRAEDLYVFTLRHLSLKRGERAVLPVAEYRLPYRDIYTLELPNPAAEEEARSGDARANREISRLARVYRATHRIRLQNTGSDPITTAPALIVSGDRVLAQTLTAFTPREGELDLPLTTAGDVKALHSDRETGRRPGVFKRGDFEYSQVAVAGAVSCSNQGRTAVDLEVTLLVPGMIDGAEREGRIEQLPALGAEGPFGADRLPDEFSRVKVPSWSWWTEVNGVGRITWRLRLEPGQTTELPYTWHYYTR